MEYGIVMLITIIKQQQNMFHYGIWPSKTGVTNDIRQTEKKTCEGLYNLVFGGSISSSGHNNNNNNNSFWGSDEERCDKHGMILE